MHVTTDIFSWYNTMRKSKEANPNSAIHLLIPVIKESGIAKFATSASCLDNLTFGAGGQIEGTVVSMKTRNVPCDDILDASKLVLEALSQFEILHDITLIQPKLAYLFDPDTYSSTDKLGITKPIIHISGLPKS